MFRLAKLFIVFLIAVIALLPAHIFAQANQPSTYDAVDPIIGTASGGNTFPGATLPFGMIQWSPDTGSDGWYDYQKNSITGFSLTHISGAGCPIYGDFPMLPITGTLSSSPATDPAAYTQTFSHSQEQAHPGYYSVVLSNGIQVELTVTDRAGIARIQFPAGQAARLLVNSGGSANTRVHPGTKIRPGRGQDGNQIEIIGKNELRGSATAGGFCGSPTRYKIYFAAQFKQPIRNFSTWNDATIESGQRKAAGRHTGAWLDFGQKRQLQWKIGISFVSKANALANLKQEIPGWNFDRVHTAARDTWTNLFNQVPVKGGTKDQRTIFYTGLYHMLLSPTLFSDNNGDYTGFDWKIHSLASTKQKDQYANFSDWDIYRNTIQMQSLLVPSRVGDMMQSLVNDANQSGWLPRWPVANDVSYVMGGDSPAILLSTAYSFGVRNFDTRAALHYMVKAATQPGMDEHNTEERPYLSEYLKLGYVPVDKDNIAASRTLEYASDDFAIAQFARNLGEMDIYRKFLMQSENWKNLLDPQTKWIRPRNSDGTWIKGFNAEKALPRDPKWNVQIGYEEGDTYQYSFMVPFDYPELIQSMGGDAETVPRLDAFFSKLSCWNEPCFNMGNEPDFVTPYTYVFAGQPWKTQRTIDRIERQTFNTKPDGIPGNDDLGATSGVYVWNALGLYPGIPGVGGLLIGTPIFPAGAIHFADGRTLAIQAEGTGPYVRQALFNGKPNLNSWLSLSSLGPGVSTLSFQLSPEPNTQRNSSSSERPPSFITK